MVLDTDNDHGSTDDESEYVPSENESLSDDNENRENDQNLRISVSEPSLNISDTVGTSACNDDAMYVKNSSIKSKKNCCVFCMKLQSQIARHLTNVHCNEPEVRKFAVLSKKHEERKKKIDILRKQGNFKYNTNADINTGQLIVYRRPTTSSKTATDFIACFKCKGFFTKNTI